MINRIFNQIAGNESNAGECFISDGAGGGLWPIYAQGSTSCTTSHMCRDYDQYAIKNMAQNKVGRLHIPYYTSDQNTHDCVKVRRNLQVGPKMFKTINQISPKSQAIKMHGIVFLEKMFGCQFTLRDEH